MTHVPRKRYGQHFLHDRGVVARIVAAIDPRPGDPVVEIGPGRGVLTVPLLERLGHLEAIEIDRDLAARLAADHPTLALHRADVLKFDFARLPSGLRVVGNLPYNISTPFLFHLARFAGRVRDAHLMLQREVVDRMVAAPSTPDYGRLSVMLQYRFEMRKLFDVKPGAFTPAPRVDSAFVRLVPRLPSSLAARDDSALARVVTAAFTKRRKTLRNALAGLLDEEALRALGIDPQLRPENLGILDYVAIANSEPLGAGAAGEPR